MPSIQFDHVSYDYLDNDERYRALDDIDFEVRDGEFVCLVGHSGCGKSTLLSLLAGLTLPTEGTISLDGRPVEGPGPDRSIVFQSYSLFPWLTALKNVSFAIRETHPGMGAPEATERAHEMLARVEMEEAEGRYPFQLSGGMQQRVAIARSLAMDADTMLFDEPFGALDPLIRGKLQELLLQLWGGSERRKTVVFVTHDINEALVLADRIVFMEPKRIVGDFTLETPRPRNADDLGVVPELRDTRNRIRALFEQSHVERGRK